jgi:hypothetical protein
MKRLVVRNRPVTLEEKLSFLNSIFRSPPSKQLVVGPLFIDLIWNLIQKWRQTGEDRTQSGDDDWMQRARQWASRREMDVGPGSTRLNGHVHGPIFATSEYFK